MKGFYESLQDNFEHITEISDPLLLQKLRAEGINIDTEGMYVFSLGEHKEIEIIFLPIGEKEGHYLLRICKNGINIIDDLPVWTNEK